MGAAAQLFVVMMAVMTPVILIVFIGKYFNYKTTIAKQFSELKKEIHENSKDDLEQEIAKLKERIVALESIVTDRSYNLERKISNL